MSGWKAGMTGWRRECRGRIGDNGAAIIHFCLMSAPRFTSPFSAAPSLRRTGARGCRRGRLGPTPPRGLGRSGGSRKRGRCVGGNSRSRRRRGRARRNRRRFSRRLAGGEGQREDRANQNERRRSPKSVRDFGDDESRALAIGSTSFVFSVIGKRAAAKSVARVEDCITKAIRRMGRRFARLVAIRILPARLQLAGAIPSLFVLSEFSVMGEDWGNAGTAGRRERLVLVPPPACLPLQAHKWEKGKGFVARDSCLISGVRIDSLRHPTERRALA